MENEVLEFINRRFKVDCNWLNGNCYYFAVILKNRFPDGEIVYDQIKGHFMFLLNDILYDYSGIVDSDYDKLDNIKKTDPLLYSYLVRDCMR
jgi:hypothetical protein